MLDTVLRLASARGHGEGDGAAERAYDRQRELIRAAAPDIVALQESDTARVGLNIDAHVRYFAAKLGWHAWYGPATVTEAFGTVEAKINIGDRPPRAPDRRDLVGVGRARRWPPEGAASTPRRRDAIYLIAVIQPSDVRRAE